jgi:hypothetical protein
MKTKYPRYHLFYKTGHNDTSYHSRRKKSFLYRLDGLSQLKTLKEFHFVVEYYKNGFNESIVYTKNQIKEALKVARIFTAKSEERAFVK